jgi:glycine/D-amino acid oxidase-like deaminating enzyme
MKPVYDAIVVGGGLVGSALAFGLQRQGLSTLILDEGDIAIRATRGNFGLIWVQSKGINFSPYAQWTWKSAELWEELSAQIYELTNIDVGYRRPGGAEICIDEAEFTAKREKMECLQSHSPHVKFEMLDQQAMAEMLPGLGPDVAGGCYSPGDGHANPLDLLRGLHQGFQSLGGKIESGDQVSRIEHQKSSFSIKTIASQYHGARVVIAAGLGSKKLGEMVGMNIPVHPDRGQILVTERLKNFLNIPLSKVRQTLEGSVQIGDSHEDAGLDVGTSTQVLNRISARAVRMFPHLGKARIVRAWSALRIMTPDGYPIYDQSEQYPGAFSAVCHSGVTLAAAHALRTPNAIIEGSFPNDLIPLSANRFLEATDHA